MRLIPKRWAPVASAASTDETRRFLCGVHVVEQADGAVRLEATDGGRAIRIEGKTVPTCEFPIIDGLDVTGAETELREGIVPIKAFVAGMKAVPTKAHIPVLGHMAVALNGDTATLASTDLSQKSVAKVDTIPGPFPRIDSVIPQGEPAACVCVNAQLLGETLLALAKMASGGATPAVTISVYGSLGVLKITAKGEDGEQITALVAPLRTKEAKR